MGSIEVNFDGLVGLTHHYAGLSFGNIASTRNKFRQSNPWLAAKQGLLKMKTLADMGFVQGVFPPHERPYLPILRDLGFTGNDEQILTKTAQIAPKILSAVSSASGMWLANAATVSPSIDSSDSKVHFTVANLNNKFHRSIEGTQTSRFLRSIFHDSNHFFIHDSLPQVALFSDEGAANHCRISIDYETSGLQLFIYGCEFKNKNNNSPKRYPARQTREASESIARLHRLIPENTMFVQQNPMVIDQGVFHNDVISVSNKQVLFCHQKAFLNQLNIIEEIKSRVSNFTFIEVPEEKLSISDALESYLFNSQLLSLPDNSMILVLPKESQEHRRTWDYLNDELFEKTIIKHFKTFDLHESMKNGGGPACLRLRVLLTEEELSSINQSVLINECLFKNLNSWIDRHYRDRLSMKDLSDPLLLRENYDALDELTKLLKLGNVYSFQK